MSNAAEQDYIVTCPIYTYGTHVLPLVVAMMVTEGDVLEVGTGAISTPLLSALVKYTKRNLVSLEESPHWFQAMSAYRHEQHQIRHVADIRKALPAVGGDWGLALVDNEIPGRAAITRYRDRVWVVKQLRAGTDVIVVHDTEFSWFQENQEWLELRKSFKYQWEFKMVKPWTLVLSNEIDVRSELANSVC